ncbi:unnamed protein product, partial [Ectocarpus sp. 12 AP-2014]
TVQCALSGQTSNTERWIFVPVHGVSALWRTRTNRLRPSMFEAKHFPCVFIGGWYFDFLAHTKEGRSDCLDAFIVALNQACDGQ